MYTIGDEVYDVCTETVVCLTNVNVNEVRRKVERASLLEVRFEQSTLVEIKSNSSSLNLKRTSVIYRLYNNKHPELFSKTLSSICTISVPVAVIPQIFKQAAFCKLIPAEFITRNQASEKKAVHNSSRKSKSSEREYKKSRSLRYCSIEKVKRHIVVFLQLIHSQR